MKVHGGVCYNVSAEIRLFNVGANELSKIYEICEDDENIGIKVERDWEDEYYVLNTYTVTITRWIMHGCRDLDDAEKFAKEEAEILNAKLEELKRG